MSCQLVCLCVWSIVTWWVRMFDCIGQGLFPTTFKTVCNFRSICFGMGRFQHHWLSWEIRPQGNRSLYHLLYPFISPPFTGSNHHQSLSTIVNHQQPSPSIVNHYEQLTTISSHHQPLRLTTISNHMFHHDLFKHYCYSSSYPLL